MDFSRVYLEAARKYEGRPARYAKRRDITVSPPFTYLPCHVLTSKKH